MAKGVFARWRGWVQIFSRSLVEKKHHEKPLAKAWWCHFSLSLAEKEYQSTLHRTQWRQWLIQCEEGEMHSAFWHIFTRRDRNFSFCALHVYAYRLTLYPIKEKKKRSEQRMRIPRFKSGNRPCGNTIVPYRWLKRETRFENRFKRGGLKQE